MRLIATIPDSFWTDYLLHSMVVDGVHLLGQLSWDAGKYHPRRDDRIKLFWFIVQKMRACDYIRHNVIDRRRELYVR